MRAIATFFTLAAAVLTASAALAQAPSAPPPPQPPSGGTPEQMPFATPYGTPISVGRAQQLANAVLAEAAKHPTWRFNIAVVDPNGDLIYFYRMDGAQLASITIAQGKARTAARFRRETRTFYNAYETGHPYVSTLDPTLVASPGGFPLIDNGRLIGAIGCSGGTGDQDATVCAAGAAALPNTR